MLRLSILLDLRRPYITHKRDKVLPAKLIAHRALLQRVRCEILTVERVTSQSVLVIIVGTKMNVFLGSHAPRLAFVHSRVPQIVRPT